MPLPVPTADRSLAIALAVTCFLGFLLFHRGLFASTDEVGVFETTRAMFERRDLDVPAGLHSFPGRDGRIYSHFAIGQSVLALPFYGLGRLADATLPFRVRQSLAGPRTAKGPIVFGGSVEIFAVALYGPVASAALVALFLLFERRFGASPRAATMAALLLAGATYVAALSTYFLQHTTETLAILAALYFLYGFRRDGRPRDLALGSACAAATVLIRVPAAIAVPALAGYALFALRERVRAGDRAGPLVAALAAPAALVAVLHVAVNHAKWGTWIASPFLSQFGVLGSPLTPGLVGLLVSPGAGLFAYAPLTFLAPWLFADFGRRHRAEGLAAYAIFVSLWLLGGSFPAWTGLWSAPGPRYLFAATPLLLLPLGPWLDAHRSRAAHAVVITLAALGAFVQLAILLADWPAVIELEHYVAWSPPKGFVWSFAAGPIVASVRAVANGWLGPWLWTIATGWEGRPGTPGAALAILALWAVAFAWSIARLRRALAAATA
jgi:hypothetical protein